MYAASLKNHAQCIDHKLLTKIEGFDRQAKAFWLQTTNIEHQQTHIHTYIHKYVCEQYAMARQ